jgi:hypothetical protein
MTKDIAVGMRAVLMLLALTIFAAGVREHQRWVLRLIKLPTEACVLRHGILGVGVIAVRASPAEECEYLLGNLGSFALIRTILIILLIGPGGRHLLLLLLIVLVVEFLDPPLDAAEVERLLALATIPEGASLVNLIVADQALLVALR